MNVPSTMAFLAKLIDGTDKAMRKDPHGQSSAYAIEGAYNTGYSLGIEHARRVLRLQLGLGVPGDTA